MKTSPPIDRRCLMQTSVAAMTAAAFPSSASAIAKAHADAERLSIDGNVLLRGGKPIRLLGVSVADPIFVRKGRTLEDYRVIADDWHSNVVRISMHPCHWRADASSAFKALANDITGARARGLIVILDWHAIGFPDGYTERPDPIYGLPPDAYLSSTADAVEFWREMALSFGHDPGIIFELWNEPIFANTLIVSTGQHWPKLKELWLKLLAEIRRSSDAIVMAAGDRFAHDLKGVANDLIEDDRVAYAWHCYPQMDRTLPDRWAVSLEQLPSLKPIFVTEWGFCSHCEEPVFLGTPEDLAHLSSTRSLSPTGCIRRHGCEARTPDRPCCNRTKFRPSSEVS